MGNGDSQTQAFVRRLVQHEHFSVKLTSKQHIQKKKKKQRGLDKEQTQQVKIVWTQEVNNRLNTNYMQQDNTTVNTAQTADTKHVEVNDENNKFTVRNLTVKACLQLHAHLSKHSSIGPKQLCEPYEKSICVSLHSICGQ